MLQSIVNMIFHICQDDLIFLVQKYERAQKFA